MIETCEFAYFDNDRCFHKVIQVWALIPATGVWTIVRSEEVAVDPADRPTCPTRPA